MRVYPPPGHGLRKSTARAYLGERGLAPVAFRVGCSPRSLRERAPRGGDRVHSDGAKATAISQLVSVRGWPSQRENGIAL